MAGDRPDRSLGREPLSERDVMAVGILYTELAKAVPGVIDRVVDASPSLLNLNLDRIDIVDPEVRIPHLVHDPPVRHAALGLIRQGDEDDRRITRRRSEVRRIPEHVTLKPQAVAEVVHLALKIRD